MDNEVGSLEIIVQFDDNLFKRSFGWFFGLSIRFLGGQVSRLFHSNERLVGRGEKNAKKKL
jgi:hypothetical protein